KEPIGIDIYDPSAAAAFERAGLNTVSAWPAMSAARVVKTPDELECLKISSAIGDTSFWKIEHEWLKPGVRESEITAKVNEYLYTQGFDFVYDIIVASGGNTSPYRRWHTDKVIREGDLVIVDQNAVGPGGYFVDFVRCFKVGGRWTAKEKDLYKECYESMYAAIEMMKAGNTTADVAAKLPKYADDEFGTVTLQQFAHSIGLSLYEGMWISRAYSLDYPVELEENMYFAAETFAGHPGLEQTVRLEENLLVTRTGRASSPSTRSPRRRSRRTAGAGRRHRPRLRRSRHRARRSRGAGRGVGPRPLHGRGDARRGGVARRRAARLLRAGRRARRRGCRRQRLQGDRALRDRGRQRRRRRGHAGGDPRHERPRLLRRGGRRPRDGAPARVRAAAPAGDRQRPRRRLGAAARSDPPDRRTSPGAPRRRSDRSQGARAGAGVRPRSRRLRPLPERSRARARARGDAGRRGRGRRLRLAARPAHRGDAPPDRRAADRRDAESAVRRQHLPRRSRRHRGGAPGARPRRARRSRARRDGGGAAPGRQPVAEPPE